MTTSQMYHRDDVERSFRLFAQLMREGKVAREQDGYRDYTVHGAVRDLAELYSAEVDAVLEKTSDYLYLIPKVTDSYFHIKNTRIKQYLPNGATNLDVYLMYFAILVLFGAFYNSYESSEPTRDFLTYDEWMRLIDERITSLADHQAETDEASEDLEWNWTGVVKRWGELDHLRENAKKLDARQNTRFGYMQRYFNFLQDQDLAEDQSNQEIVLTEKAKVIVQRYFMNKEYNRGILQFMYEFDQVQGEEE